MTNKVKLATSEKEKLQNMFRLHVKSSKFVPNTYVEEYKLPNCKRKWRFDFAWPSHMLLVELEGGTWGKKPSRHTTGKGFQDDCIKYNEAELRGYCLFRFDTPMIRRLDALLTVERFFGKYK